MVPAPGDGDQRPDLILERATRLLTRELVSDDGVGCTIVMHGRDHTGGDCRTQLLLPMRSAADSRPVSRICPEVLQRLRLAVAPHQGWEFRNPDVGGLVETPRKTPLRKGGRRRPQRNLVPAGQPRPRPFPAWMLTMARPTADRHASEPVPGCEAVDIRQVQQLRETPRVSGAAGGCMTSQPQQDRERRGERAGTTAAGRPRGGLWHAAPSARDTAMT